MRKINDEIDKSDAELECHFVKNNNKDLEEMQREAMVKKEVQETLVKKMKDETCHLRFGRQKETWLDCEQSLEAMSNEHAVDLSNMNFMESDHVINREARKEEESKAGDNRHVSVDKTHEHGFFLRNQIETLRQNDVQMM